MRSQHVQHFFLTPRGKWFTVFPGCIERYAVFVVGTCYLPPFLCASNVCFRHRKNATTIIIEGKWVVVVWRGRATQNSKEKIIRVRYTNDRTTWFDHLDDYKFHGLRSTMTLLHHWSIVVPEDSFTTIFPNGDGFSWKMRRGWRWVCGEIWPFLGSSGRCCRAAEARTLARVPQVQRVPVAVRVPEPPGPVPKKAARRARWPNGLLLLCQS